MARAGVLDELAQFTQVGLDRSATVPFDFHAFFDGLKQTFGHRSPPFQQQWYLTFLQIRPILDDEQR